MVREKVQFKNVDDNALNYGKTSIMGCYVPIENTDFALIKIIKSLKNLLSHKFF